MTLAPYIVARSLQQELSLPRMLWSWHTGTASASNTEAGYSSEGPNERETSKRSRWKPASLPATWTRTFATLVEIDTVCIGAHTLGSSGADITVEVRFSVGGDWAHLFNLSPQTDLAIMKNLGRQSIGGIRVTINATSDSAPEIGIVAAGLVLKSELYVYSNSISGTESVSVKKDTHMSQNGNYLGTFIRSRQLTDIPVNWSYLSEDWVNNNLPSLLSHLQDGGTFFYARRLEYFPDDVFYGWPSSSIRPARPIGVRDFHEFSFTAGGLYG